RHQRCHRRPVAAFQRLPKSKRVPVDDSVILYARDLIHVIELPGGAAFEREVDGLLPPLARNDLTTQRPGKLSLRITLREVGFQVTKFEMQVARYLPAGRDVMEIARVKIDGGNRVLRTRQRQADSIAVPNRSGVMPQPSRLQLLSRTRRPGGRRSCQQ